jgi:predicted RNA-binding Zn ribbon-like protein
MNFPPVFFSGGLTCLDFINTIDHRHTPPKYDFFADRAALLEWGRAAGILPDSARDPRNSDPRAFQQALETRALLVRLLMPFSESKAPAGADLAAFNLRLQEVSARTAILHSADGYQLRMQSADPVEQVMYAALRSAADLLLNKEKERIRQCRECGWLFYDSTRNRFRRWCDMGTCGNRAKARRHYERVKEEKLRASRKKVRRGGPVPS